MKKTIFIILAVIIGLSAVAVVTCPNKQDHKDAIMNTFKELMAEELEKEKDDFGDSYSLVSGLSSIAENVLGWAFNESLIVKNRFLYSEGFIQDGGQQKRISVGVFGHVFTFSKEDLKKMIEEAL